MVIRYCHTMIIRYCPLSSYGYPVIVRHHYGYPLLSDITLWLSFIVRYHCPLSSYGYPLLSAIVC